MAPGTPATLASFNTMHHNTYTITPSLAVQDHHGRIVGAVDTEGGLIRFSGPGRNLQALLDATPLRAGEVVICPARPITEPTQ